MRKLAHETVLDAIKAMDPAARPTAFALVWLENGNVDPLAFWVDHQTDEARDRLKVALRMLGGL